jgi:hypothetical protein
MEEFVKTIEETQHGHGGVVKRQGKCDRDVSRRRLEQLAGEMGRLAAELKKLEAVEAKRKKKEDLLAKVCRVVASGYG